MAQSLYLDMEESSEAPEMKKGIKTGNRTLTVCRGGTPEPFNSDLPLSCSGLQTSPPQCLEKQKSEQFSLINYNNPKCEEILRDHKPVPIHQLRQQRFNTMAGNMPISG